MNEKTKFWLETEIPKFTEMYTSMQGAVDDRKGAGHLHLLAASEEVSC